jgi:aspartyl protease family protein
LLAAAVLDCAVFGCGGRMKQILGLAFVVLVIAGIVPRMMNQTGQDLAVARPAPGQAPARTSAPAKPSSNSGNSGAITVLSDRRGHFQVEGAVDGRRLDFMVDTGATVVALREGDASKLGIHPSPRDYTGLTSTANGVIKVAPVRLSSIEISGIRIYDVPAVVIPDRALSVNLLGMTFLSRLRRFEMSNGKLVMEQW